MRVAIGAVLLTVAQVLVLPARRPTPICEPATGGKNLRAWLRRPLAQRRSDEEDPETTIAPTTGSWNLWPHLERAKAVDGHT